MCFLVFLRWKDGNLKQLSSSQVCVYGVECMLQLFGIPLCTYICIWSRTIKEFWEAAHMHSANSARIKADVRKHILEKKRPIV